MAEFELDGINSCLVFCLALVVDFETRIWNAQYLKLYIQIMYLIENTKNIFFLNAEFIFTLCISPYDVRKRVGFQRSNLLEFILFSSCM